MTQYLKPKQVAEQLQLAERTLANQRSQGRGIPFVKIGRAVRYSAVDVDAYLVKHYNQAECKQELVTNDEGGCDEI